MRPSTILIPEEEDMRGRHLLGRTGEEGHSTWDEEDALLSLEGTARTTKRNCETPFRTFNLVFFILVFDWT